MASLARHAILPPAFDFGISVGAKDVFSANFRRLLDAKFGGNAADFCRATSFSSAKVSKWSRGLAFPEVSNLDVIAKTFNVSLADLFSESEDADSGERSLEDVRDTLKGVYRDLDVLLKHAPARKPKKSR